MKNTMNRRTFSKTIAAGVGAAAVAPLAGQGKKLQIGCTTLIWRCTPRQPENLEPAVKDMASLGFHKFETFAAVLADWDKQGKMQPLVDQYKIPLVSVYASRNLTDPSVRKEQLQELIGWAKVLKKYGGNFFVLAPNGTDRAKFNFKEHRKNIIDSLNEYAMAITDLGLGTGLHQHTGTTIETRDEVYAVMENVNTKHLKFAPDIGQIQKGGADAAQVVKDFLPITVQMHIKDWDGGEHYAEYCPLGRGKVDIKSILEMVEKTNPQGNYMFEIDFSDKQPYDAHETTKISRDYLASLGYKFKA
jgi:inosose dehydratase